MTGFWATSSLPSLSERSASPTELLLLADAAPEIGAGHAMRCAALAEAWRDQRLGAVVFSGRVTIPFVRTRLEAGGVAIIAANAARAIAAARVLVLDSYDPSRRAEGLELASTLRVLVDDLAESIPNGFDVIWNPNAYGARGMYPSFRGNVVTGPEAVPLRRGLPTWNAPAERAIGVGMGGGAIPGALRAAIEALPARFPQWQVYSVGTWARGKLQRIDEDDPWPQLARCDRLLIAAGTTTWEAAAVGIPVALVQTASNQARIFEWARRAGAPGVKLDDVVDEGDLATSLAEAVMSAARLPKIKSGAATVARRLARLAGQRAAPS